jgi:hypothetical protein
MVADTIWSMLPYAAYIAYQLSRLQSRDYLIDKEDDSAQSAYSIVFFSLRYHSHTREPPAISAMAAAKKSVSVMAIL